MSQYLIVVVNRSLARFFTLDPVEFPELELLSKLGDVRDPARVEQLFAEYRPEIVFHAAAYKHVPMLEEHASQAVRVNMGGTQAVVDAAIDAGIRATGAESMLNAESSITEAVLSEVQHLVSEEVTPITDHRSTEGYRRHASGVLARRLVERCVT